MENKIINLAEHEITVIKLNTQRQETWRYPGRILSQDGDSILIEAFFNREDLPFHGITLRKNDRFLERYYANRWYNIFEIHDRADDRLKAWYCNVTTPAEFSPGKVAYVDLALDLLVYPDGTYLVLDEDEFQNLDIEQPVRLNARQALNTLIQMAETGHIDKAIAST
jgi:protein associated with RNAse G/E